MLTLGLPLACSTLLMSVSNMLSNRLMISYGSTALATQGVASKVGMLLSLTKGCFFLPILYLMKHFFGMYGISFTGAVTLIFSLAAGIFFSLKWYRADVQTSEGKHVLGRNILCIVKYLHPNRETCMINITKDTEAL